MRFVTVESVQTRMLRCTRPSERWLWCACCERFFHADRLRRDPWGLRQACPLKGCTGNGFDLDIFFWDRHRHPEDTRWPSSTSQLETGMRSPDREQFYAERNRRRREAIISAFQSSRDIAALEAAHPAGRYVRLLLEHADTLSVDPEDIDGELFGELVYDIPRLLRAGRGAGGNAGSDARGSAGSGADNDAPGDDRQLLVCAIIAELTAFFAFTRRELDFEHASDCLDVLASDAHAALEQVMGLADAADREPRTSPPAGPEPGHEIACTCHGTATVSIQ